MGEAGAPPPRHQRAAGATWARSDDPTWPDHVPTVPGLLRHAVAHHPDNLAVADVHERLSYAELDRRSAALAAHLVARGVGKGTHVGTLLPNGVAWVVAWAAICRIGAVSTPVNTFYQVPEMATMLRHADVGALVASTSFGAQDHTTRLVDVAPGLARCHDPALLLPELPQLRRVLFWDHAEVPWADAGIGATLDDAPDPALAAVVAAMEDDVTPADPMLITYTSGSTGAPKGVVHGHGPLLRHARNLAALSGLGPDDRIWTPMPLCWVGGFAFTLLRALSVGGAFVTQERMDAGTALALFERERVTGVSAWPGISVTLTAHPDFATTDLSALRTGTFLEGRPAEFRPPDPGLAVTSLGMSETGGPHTFWTQEEDLHGTTEEYRGTFGHAVPGMAHRIVDDDGHDVDEGVEGEVWVRGYAMMLGLHKQERTDVFDADGWYRTGDRGLFRDGWFFFTGRQGDLIKARGSNVAPSEVEKALVSLDGVTAAYVFGVDHPVDGQEVVALVVGDADPDDVHAQLRDLLSAYKRPRRLFPLAAADVPFLTSQKPDRRRLAALAGDLTEAARAAD